MTNIKQTITHFLGIFDAVAELTRNISIREFR